MYYMDTKRLEILSQMLYVSPNPGLPLTSKNHEQPSGQNLADSLGIVVVAEGIHAEI